MSTQGYGVLLVHLFRALKVVVLFGIGVSFAATLNCILLERNSAIFPRDALAILRHCWWIFPIVGMAATLVGLLYPCVDTKLGDYCHPQEGAKVLKCVAFFVGMKLCCTKLDYANNLHMAVVLGLLSLLIWWLFDSTKSGLVVALSCALVAALVIHALISNGLYGYPETDFTYLKSWLPSIFFSGSITMGTIGRQLVLVENSLFHNSSKKVHVD